MKFSQVMQNLMKQLDEIGKASLPLCKHGDRKVSDAAVKINQLAQKAYKELNKVEHNARGVEQKLDLDEPVIRFL